MGKVKIKLAKALSPNVELNRKALLLKKSLDEVAHMLKNENKEKQ